MHILNMFFSCFEAVTNQEFILKSGKKEEECVEILENQLKNGLINIKEFLQTDDQDFKYDINIYKVSFKKHEEGHIKYSYFFSGNRKIAIGYIFEYKDNFYNVIATKEFCDNELEEKKKINEIFKLNKQFSVYKFVELPSKKYKVYENDYDNKVLEQNILNCFQLDVVNDTVKGKEMEFEEIYNKEITEEKFKNKVFKTQEEFFKINKKSLNLLNLKKANV